MVFVVRMVAPVSACTSDTSSGWRSSSREAARLNSSDRCSGVVRDHAGNAAAAASAAASASAAVALGACPTTSSVAGLTMA